MSTNIESLAWILEGFLMQYKSHKLELMVVYGDNLDFSFKGLLWDRLPSTDLEAQLPTHYCNLEV